MSAGTLFRFAGEGGSAAPKAAVDAAPAATGDAFPF